MNADMQIHINGDVMMAIKQYLYATGDLLWLEHEGAPHPAPCERVYEITHAPTYSSAFLPALLGPSRALPPAASGPSVRS